MNINEVILVLKAAREKLGGDTPVFIYVDDGERDDAEEEYEEATAVHYDILQEHVWID